MPTITVKISEIVCKTLNEYMAKRCILVTADFDIENIADCILARINNAIQNGETEVTID